MELFIRVDVHLPGHPKSLDLDEQLGECDCWRYVVRLWAWTMIHESLTGFLPKTNEGIAKAAGWNGDPGLLVTALLSASGGDKDDPGFIEECQLRGAKRRRVRNWKKINREFIRARKDAKRKRASRKRDKREGVTVTARTRTVRRQSPPKSESKSKSSKRREGKASIPARPDLETIPPIPDEAVPEERMVIETIRGMKGYSPLLVGHGAGDLRRLRLILRAFPHIDITKTVLEMQDYVENRCRRKVKDFWGTLRTCVRRDDEFGKNRRQPPEEGRAARNTPGGGPSVGGLLKDMPGKRRLRPCPECNGRRRAPSGDVCSVCKGGGRVMIEEKRGGG
jgi:hypothetical protein